MEKVMCIVVTSGLFLSPAMNAKEIPVGTELELTERKLEAYTGKVRRKDTNEASAAAVSAELVAGLEARVQELEAALQSSSGQVKTLSTEVIELTQKLDEKDAVIKNLEAELAE